jgi:hypothetical protein
VGQHIGQVKKRWGNLARKLDRFGIETPGSSFGIEGRGWRALPSKSTFLVKSICFTLIFFVSFAWLQSPFLDA